jgi:hypothetical protein
MSDTPTFKDRAVQTLALDIPVIRLRPRDKAALDTGWPALATTDLRTVCKWNSETPDANVGAVAKAELNAVWFFEIDSLDVIKRIETETGQKIPPTYRVRSRPGRGHYYWRQTPESIALGNIAQSFVKHGDFSVRVHNEYVVGALSINPKSGEPYTVAEDSPIAPCPTWLIDWIKAQRVEQKKAAFDDLGPIPDGARNSTLASIAGKLRSAGMAQEDIEEHLKKVNAERCQPPLPDGDIKTIAGSIARYPAGDPANEVAYVGSSNKAAEATKAEEILPLVSVDGDSFIKESIPPRRVLIQLKDKKSPIFTEQSINQIFAWRGLGKTNIGFGLTAAFAKGGDLLNWEAPQRSRVLYIEGELPAAQAQERWKQIIGETNERLRSVNHD